MNCKVSSNDTNEKESSEKRSYNIISSPPNNDETIQTAAERPKLKILFHSSTKIRHLQYYLATSHEHTDSTVYDHHLTYSQFFLHFISFTEIFI